MQKTNRRKLELNKETVRRLALVSTVDTFADPEEPLSCPTDGTRTCVIGR